jgi:hypothetical protein
MKKHILISMFVAAAILGFAATTVKADSCGQYGQYGGCPPAESIIVNKLVGKVVVVSKDGQTIQYVDNLSLTDPRFKAGDIVMFQVKVKNGNSDANSVLTNVKVVDKVPTYLTPLEGPGNYDSTTRLVTFYIPQLQSNEERTYTFKMQVVSVDALNSIAEGACQSNKAEAWAGNAYGTDMAQFCVEKVVPPGVTQVPSTGPEDVIPAVMATISALGAGIFLKKKATK